MSYRRGNTHGHGRGHADGSKVFSKSPLASSLSAPWRQPDGHQAPPVGPVLKAITREHLESSAGSVDFEAKITGCDYIASYNWITSDNPTMLVPGKPPLWTPPDEPTSLKEDEGEYYRDLNAAKYPQHSTEPAVRAILTEDPAFASDEINVFACGNTIGNLLKFVKEDNKVFKPFRFLAEIVGETVFFVRREDSPTQKIPDVRGYGHSFPAKYCTWESDVTGSESHQRVIRYDFAGLNCVVRSETDGYLKYLAGEEVIPEKQPESPIPMHADNSAKSPLTIKRGGSRVPQASIFDLKTRSARMKELHDTISEEISSLWLTQTPNLILAYHNSGTFDDIEVMDVRKKVATWEQENEATLCRLRTLISDIVAFVKSTPGGKCEVHRSAADRLDLREQTQDTPPALPVDLKAIWAGGSRSLLSDSDSESESAIRDSDEEHEDEEYLSDENDEFHADAYLVESPGEKFRFGSYLDFDGEEEGKKYAACAKKDCEFCAH